MIVEFTTTRHFLVKAALFVGVSSLLLSSTHATFINANSIEIMDPSSYHYFRAPTYVVAVVGSLIITLLVALIAVTASCIMQRIKAKKAITSKEIKKTSAPLKIMSTNEYFAVPSNQNKGTQAKDAQIKELKKEAKRDDAQAKDMQLKELQKEDAQANDMDNAESDKEAPKDGSDRKQVTLQMEKPYF